MCLRLFLLGEVTNLQEYSAYFKNECKSEQNYSNVRRGGFDSRQPKTATPKLARFLSVQPLNRRFCCRPQKLCKALCGRRCRPLCPARESEATPRFLLLIFVPPADFGIKGAKTVPNSALPLQGLCLPDSWPYLATRGGTGAYGRGFGGNINVAHLHSPR